MKTLEERIREAGVRIDTRRGNAPDHAGDAGMVDMDWWQVKLTRRGTDAQFTLTYGMGYGHHGNAPHLDTVLDSALSDAAGTEYPFEEWADAVGYDPDSRKAERIYRLTCQQTEKLKTWLGDDFTAWVYETERI